MEQKLGRHVKNLRFQEDGVLFFISITSSLADWHTRRGTTIQHVHGSRSSAVVRSHIYMTGGASGKWMTSQFPVGIAMETEHATLRMRRSSCRNQLRQLRQLRQPVLCVMRPLNSLFTSIGRLVNDHNNVSFLPAWFASGVDIPLSYICRHLSTMSSLFIYLFIYYV